MKSTEPIFKQILKSEWDSLALVIKTHYSLTPFTNQRIEMKGTMESVTHSPIAKVFIPINLILGALVPYQGKNVPVEVCNWTQENKAAFYWKRF
jgi:hypothetical protein